MEIVNLGGISQHRWSNFFRMWGTGSIVINNLRVGSISLVLIQSVSKGNNYCILLYFLFNVTFCLGLGGGCFGVARSSHISCVPFLWDARPQALPEPRGLAWGKHRKHLPENENTHKKQHFGKTLELFCTFTTFMPLLRQTVCLLSCFCGFFLVAGVPQPVLQCHLPIAGQDQGKLLVQNTTSLDWKWGSFDSPGLKNTFDRLAKR